MADNFIQRQLNPRSRATSGRSGRTDRIRSSFVGGGTPGTTVSAPGFPSPIAARQQPVARKRRQFGEGSQGLEGGVLGGESAAGEFSGVLEDSIMGSLFGGELQSRGLDAGMTTLGGLAAGAPAGAISQAVLAGMASSLGLLGTMGRGLSTTFAARDARNAGRDTFGRTGNTQAGLLSAMASFQSANRGLGGLAARAARGVGINTGSFGGPDTSGIQAGDIAFDPGTGQAFSINESTGVPISAQTTFEQLGGRGTIADAEAGIQTGPQVDPTTISSTGVRGGAPGTFGGFGPEGRMDADTAAHHGFDVGTQASRGEGSGDADGDAGGTVLCTALYMQGMLPRDVYLADSAYGKTVHRNILKAYQIVARPLARLMLRSKIVTAIVRPFVSKWAHWIAGREEL